MQTPAAFMAPLALRILTCLLSATLLIGTVAPALADSSAETAQTAAATQHNPFSPYLKDKDPYIKSFHKEITADQQQLVLKVFERGKIEPGLTEKQIGRLVKDALFALSSLNEYNVWLAWLAKRPAVPLDSPVAKEWLKREPFLASNPYSSMKNIKDRFPDLISDELFAEAKNALPVFKAFKDEVPKRKDEVPKRKEEVPKRKDEVPKRTS